jgi:hypothetical protein
MNWYDILKVQTQSQRQGFRLDDKDEDYVLEDEDETCYEKLVKLFIQQEGFKITSESTNYLFLNRFIEDTELAIKLTKNNEDELYCWLFEKYSLFPGRTAIGFNSAFNRMMRTPNQHWTSMRTFKIGDISVNGGSVFYPIKNGVAILEEKFFIEGGREIIRIAAFEK